MIASAGLLVGCTMFEDQPSLLIGAWGGPDMLVVGSPGGAIVQMACGHVAIDRPLRLDQPSGFVAAGTYAPLSNNGLGQFAVRVMVSATSARDTALVKVQTIYQGVWRGDETFRVVRGQSISYPDGRLCAD
jgi:hypothetical protein